MVSSTPATHYARLSIALHWLMLVLLAAVYALIELRGLFPKDSVERNLMKDLHFMLGLSVFVLVWLRLAVRLSRPTPPIVPKPPAWQTGLAHLMHLALYLLMIGLPLAGWICSRMDPHMLAPEDNLATLRRALGSLGAPLLADLPHQVRPDPRTASVQLPQEWQ